MSPVTRSILRTAAMGSTIGGVTGAATAPSGSRTSGALKGAVVGGAAGAGLGTGVALGRASKIRSSLGNLTPGKKSSVVGAGQKLKDVKDINGRPGTGSLRR